MRCLESCQTNRAISILQEHVEVKLLSQVASITGQDQSCSSRKKVACKLVSFKASCLQVSKLLGKFTHPVARQIAKKVAREVDTSTLQAGGTWDHELYSWSQPQHQNHRSGSQLKIQPHFCYNSPSGLFDHISPWYMVNFWKLSHRNKYYIE